MCAQIPHAEDKAACPEQHRLKTMPLPPRGAEPALHASCVMANQPAAPEPKKTEAAPEPRN